MAITLMYITNDPWRAKIAQSAGVDRVWVDLEYKGKDERQSGMNTVKSNHTIEDVRNIRSVLTTSSLMVRINPIDAESKKEINAVIAAGADYIMLPMYKTREEIQTFINLVGGRAKTMLLLETREAQERLESYVDLEGIDEIHIGLNDLHLSHKKTFMFELLTDGTVDEIASVLKRHGKKFGFGGIARLGFGMLPAEHIITEHYRIGSGMAILSRSFCNLDSISDMEEAKKLFIDEVAKIRSLENELLSYSSEQFEENRKITAQLVEDIKIKMGV